jgi:hypothetical protein
MMNAGKKPAAVSPEQSMVDALVEEFVQLHGLNGGPKPKTIGELYTAVHALDQRQTVADNGRAVPLPDQRTALCLSGGGIRSASFGLGVMQALAEKKILGHFHYLSTVSGGGYIGSWLTAWRSAVYGNPGIKDKDPTVLQNLWDRAVPPYREPAELTGIRANSNYLTPKIGMLSADTWTLLALYVRNLLLNWLIYLPFFLGLFLVPLGAQAVLLTVPDWWDQSKYFLAGGTGCLFLLALTTSVGGRLGGTSARRVSQKQYLWFELLPTYFAAILLSAYVSAGRPVIWGIQLDPVWGAALGAGLYGASWLIAFVAFADKGRKQKNGWSAASWAADLLQSFAGDRDFWLLFGWTVAGALTGLLVGTGCEIASSGAVRTDHERLLVIFGLGWLAASIFLAESIYLGLTSKSARGDDEREWLARSSGWFLALSVVWAVFAAVVLYAPDVRTLFDKWFVSLFAAGSGIGAVAARIGASAKTLSTTARKPATTPSMTQILSIASILFLLTIAIVMSSHLPGLVGLLESTGYAKASIAGPNARHLLAVVAMFVLCVVFVGGFALFLNVNRFSSHALYRNRLVRAFLGSARGAAGEKSNSRDPFTGFDSHDNLRFHNLIFPPAPTDVNSLAPRPRLFHVVNMALNVVAGTNNAWQERKAESFAVTPLRSGNDHVGMHLTETYASPAGGITLGTAMAISGAAASPNQGYHSSPLVGLIMSLFNVRLGWWLGNPSRKVAVRESPRWGIFQIINEMFGLTTDKSNYIYLSDGGHFENLGLYEMVRRRCRMIVVSDGGCDPHCTFEDLGNAVRKIWIDFGVSIVFKKIEIGRRDAKRKERGKLYYALGKITYPEAPRMDAYILYLKPGFMNNGEEPADVASYALANLTFPHETTADQFFTESQMESYRSLGYYIVSKVLGDVNQVPPVQSVPMEALRDYWNNVTRQQI